LLLSVVAVLCTHARQKEKKEKKKKKTFFFSSSFFSLFFSSVGPVPARRAVRRGGHVRTRCVRVSLLSGDAPSLR
jgi:hypothetical protein